MTSLILFFIKMKASRTSKGGQPPPADAIQKPLRPSLTTLVSPRQSLARYTLPQNTMVKKNPPSKAPSTINFHNTFTSSNSVAVGDLSQRRRSSAGRSNSMRRDTQVQLKVDQAKKRSKDPFVRKQEKIREMEINLDLLHTEVIHAASDTPAHQMAARYQLKKGVTTKLSSAYHLETRTKEEPFCPIVLDEMDPEEFQNARQYFMKKMGTAKTQRGTSQQRKSGHVSLSQSLATFDERKLTRQLDELEHRHRCQIERRNRLMKELNHLKEINKVYEAVDAEIFGGGSENGSELSFMETLRKPMTPTRWNNSPALSTRGAVRSSSNMLRTPKGTLLSKTLQSSPSVRSASKFNPLSFPLSNSPSFLSGTSSQQSKILRSMSKVSLTDLRSSLLDIHRKQQQEALMTQRLRNVLDRERSTSIDKQQRIAVVKPDHRRQTQISHKVETVKRLEKMRKLIALNTLKTWGVRMKAKIRRRGGLLEGKKEQLSEEEQRSNDLMVQYYEKLRNLLSVKDTIKQVRDRQEEMKDEQKREEKLLLEKEHQFFLIDRLGLVILMQKYCVNRQKRSMAENETEVQILRKYFTNREIFEGLQQKENESPTNKKQHKNQFELMDERVEKMKKYQQYYTQNWQIIGSYHFNFELLMQKYFDSQNAVKSMEVQHNELVKLIEKKKFIYGQLCKQRDQLQDDLEFLSQYSSDDPENEDEHQGYNALLLKDQEQEQQERLLLFNMQANNLLFENTSSMVMNLLARSSFLFHNFLAKMRMRTPSYLNSLFKKYANIQEITPTNVLSGSKFLTSLKTVRVGTGTGGKKNWDLANIAEDDDQPLRISSLQSSPAKSVIKVPLPKNAKAQSPQKFLSKRLSLLSQRSNSPMGQVSLKFNFDQKTLFEDLSFLMKTLLNQLEREKEEEDDYDVFDSGTKKSKQPVLAHFQMDVRALLNDPVRQEKLDKAQNEKMGLLQANKRLSRDLKIMKTVNLQSSTASLPGQTQSQASLGTLVGFQNMVKDAIEQDRLDELEEDRYIREGKVSLRMRKVMLHKLKQKEELERKMAQRTKKQQTQLIEMFVKKEVNFMNHYLNDSNNAINNGYKMEVITSIDSSKVKNSLRARVSRNPIVQMMRNKTIEKQQQNDVKEEVENSGHLRVNSSATTMPMTQRLSASNSTSRQALFAHQHAKNMGSPPRLSMSPSFKPPAVPKLNNLVSDSKERNSLVQEQPIFRVNNRRIMTAKGPRPSVQLK